MKKFYWYDYRLFAVVALALICLKSAVGLTYRDWDGGGADDFWSNAFNWESNLIPGPDHAVNIDNPSVGQPLVGFTVDATHTQIAVGVSNGPCTLTMTGGHLSSEGNFNIGQGATGDGRVDISGGTIDIAATLYVSVYGSGELNVSGGTVNAYSIGLGYASASSSNGSINLYGGTINVETNILWYNPEHRINIAGGSLVLKGDRREEFARYVGLGWITGYGQAEPRRINMSFDPGTQQTTITAIDPIDVNQAWDPSPADFASGDVVAAGAILNWQPGTNAISHEVYLGNDYEAVCDATSADDEYQGSRTVNYFDPQGLSPGKTYFWRVDEFDGTSLHKGKVWQFTVKLPAFPGAEGAGGFAIGGRGGTLYEVTNLNDSGPGSLREALEACGARNVIFRVSGTIELDSKITVRYPYLTVAGQSAPGDGICLKNYGIIVDADHVIIRHLRIRPGDILSPGQTYKEVRAIAVNKGRDVIIDHCSTSWCTDQTLDVIYHNPQGGNVTVQWCMISESLDYSVHPEQPHGCGSLLRGGWGTKVSLHHNLYAHHHLRVPDVGNQNPVTFDSQGWTLDFRNNVIYNWGECWAGRNLCGNNGMESLTKMNYVANYCQVGPDTPDTFGYFAYLESTRASTSYFYNNMLNGTCPADQWDLVRFTSGWTTQQLNAYKQLAPFNVSSVTTDSPLEGRRRVLEEAGAVYPQRDAVDSRIVDDVMNLTGSIIDSQDEVGGWPTLYTATPPVDNDHDGIADTWEIDHQLSPANSDDALQDAGDGYTYLEHYWEEIEQTSGAPPAAQSPGHEAFDVYPDADLSWQTEPGVELFYVYFGKTNPPPLLETTSTASYDPGDLLQNTEYYWKINDGMVWNFRTIALDKVLEKFFDTFEDGNFTAAPVWTVGSGSWQILTETGSNDYLHQQIGSGDNGKIYTYAETIDEGKFELRLKFQAETNLSRTYNYFNVFVTEGYEGDSSSPRSGYYVSINNKVGTANPAGVGIRRLDNGSGVVLTSASDYESYGQWHELKFTYDSSLDADNLKVYLDDMNTPYITATDNTYTTFGTISLTNRRDTRGWRFDDIRLNGFGILVEPEYADIDGNQNVDLYDLARLMAYWQAFCTNPQEVEGADINRDGVVDIGDLTYLSNHWLWDF